MPTQLSSFPHRLLRPKAPLIRAPPLLSDFCRTEDLWVKDCSRTVTGTMKDFRSVRLLELFHAERAIVNAMVVYSITYGNAGYSLGKIADMYNRYTGDRVVGVVNFVDRGLEPAIKGKLAEVSEVLELDLSTHYFPPSELIDIILSRSKQVELLVGRFGKDHVSLINPEYLTFQSPESGLYVRLVGEVARETADVIFMPIGSGELYFNFMCHHPFGNEQWEHPHSIARIRGASVAGNPFFRVSQKSRVADKLVTPFSFFRKMTACLCYVTDDEILEAYKVANRAGLACEPSAATVFAAIRGSVLERSTTLAINTGRGDFASSSP